jgi:hypothetical protein
MKRKRTWVALSLVLLALLFLLLFGKPGPSSPEPVPAARAIVEEKPPSQPKGVPPSSEKDAGADGTHESDGTAPVTPTSLALLRLRNVTDGSPLPDTRIRITGEDGLAVEHITSSDGTVPVPVSSGVPRVSMVEEHFRLLPVKPALDIEGDTVTFWCYAVGYLVGKCDVEDASLLRGERPVVSARPTRGELGFKGRPDEGRLSTPGTPEWLERRLGPRDVIAKASVEGGSYRLEVPLFGKMAVHASAHGHGTEVARLDVQKPPGAERTLAFRLRRGAVVNALITDERGSPLPRARVTFTFSREIPTKDVDVDWLRHVKSVSRTGLTIGSNGETGMTRFALIAHRGADSGGVAHLSQEASEGGLYLLVHHPGKETFLKKLERPNEFEDATIVLKDIRPLVPGYRLRWRGKAASSGASYALHEIVDGLTLSTHGLKAGNEGLMPSDSITTGREYFLIIEDLDGIGRRFGNVRFGGQVEVDVSHFESQGM